MEWKVTIEMLMPIDIKIKKSMRMVDMHIITIKIIIPIK